MEQEGIPLAFENNETLVYIVVNKFHLWSLDKGFTICEMSISVRGGDGIHAALGDGKNEEVLMRKSKGAFKREAY